MCEGVDAQDPTPYLQPHMCVPPSYTLPTTAYVRPPFQVSVEGLRRLTRPLEVAEAHILVCVAERDACAGLRDSGPCFCLYTRHG